MWDEEERSWEGSFFLLSAGWPRHDTTTILLHSTTTARRTSSTMKQTFVFTSTSTWYHYPHIAQTFPHQHFPTLSSDPFPISSISNTPPCAAFHTFPTVLSPSP